MKNRAVFLLAAVLCFFISCNRSGRENDSELAPFKDYITSFSSGTVSANADIVVGLTFSKSDWKPNQELPRDLFSISPNVDGKVIMLPNNSIAFRPTKKLGQEKEYHLVLHLSEIIDVPKDLADFHFTVKTIAQDFTVITNDLQSYDKNLQFLNMSLKSADNLDPEIAKKLVTATQDGNPLPIKFHATPDSPADFPFVIDKVQRKATDSRIVIKWDGNPYDIESQGESEFIIPGRDSFRVVHVAIADEGNQSLRINFSDPLAKDQDFSGLVAIAGTPNLQYAVEGNLLKVFFDQPIDSRSLLEVFPGITSNDGTKMKKGYAAQVNFQQIKPEVRFLKSGTILPASSNLKLNFQAVNLNKIDVRVYRIFENNVLQFLQDNELNGSYNLRKVASPIAKRTLNLTANKMTNYKKWNSYSIDLSTLIEPEPGAIYRVEMSIRKGYSIYTCSSSSATEEEESENFTEDDPEDFTEWDDYDYYDYDYEWSERENPCSNSYYSNKKIWTNVLATNLGVIAKRGDNGSYFFAVNDITTTEPISGATIDLFSLQRQKVASVKTDGNGTAIVESEKKAYFAVVKKDNNTTYIKLDDGNSQSLSNFNVDGGEVLQKGLKGYIYGERGVWRPGDNVYLSFILNDKASRIPKLHPVKIRVSDPNGKVVHQAVEQHSDLNHYKFQFKTSADAPTGNYEAVVSVGGAKFYKSLKIETIKPNRLKIKNGFQNMKISAARSNEAEVSVAWLHGAVAKNLKVEMQAKFSGQETTFKNYADYVFDDPARGFSGEEVNIFSGNVDENGRAKVKIDPQLQSEAPGMLKVAFITKAYETGGDFSMDVVNATYSPYQIYIGIKSPESNKYGMLETGTANKFDIVSVDESGRPKLVRNLSVKVYKVQWRWWWDASDDDLSSYNSTTSTTPYYETAVSTNSAGRAQFSFTADENDWGRYLVRVYDPTSGHSTGQTVMIDWPSWSGKTRNMTGAEAKMLIFTSDKEKYNVGEKAVISFPSSAGSRALVSVENGSAVLKTVWANTKEGETQVEIPIEAGMAPNIYVHITLLQPHATTRNDSPIRLYGVIPIEVIDKNTVLQPVVSMPEVLKPEQKTTIKVAEKTGKAMTYTIAIVDDGLLDLTRFKTPNAWDNFFSREALGVKTWDVYDDVIGAYGGRINQVFSIGGDADLGGGKAKKADRFKPVVIYLGPFHLPAGQSKSHAITLPKYVGSVRTMVVAANSDSGAYGSAEKTTPVRSPLMVLASLPRKIAPGEKVILPVTVFAMEKHVKNVSLQVKTNKGFKVYGPSSQSVSFTQPDEKMAYFELEAAEITGIGKVNITAVSGKERAGYDVEMDVVNPNPLTQNYSEIILEAGQSSNLSWQPFGIVGSNSAKLEVSSFPSIDFNRRLAYLIQYPHGCVEQTTSGVFPQLYIADIADVDAARKQSIQRNVTAGIQSLSKYQIGNGGFAYWPGLTTADDWGTTYAGHFLVEAEKKGYALPANMKKQWLSYQRKAAKQWRYYAPYRNDFPQAYRLYSLALAGSPDLSSMNRLRETVGLSNESKLRLAAAYILAGQKSAGQQLLAQSKIEEEPEQFDYYYYGSPDRNRAMALETLILLGRKSEAFKMAVKIANAMSSDQWMSTQTSAFSLYAISKFAKQNASSGVNAVYSASGKQDVVKTNKSFAERPLGVSSGNNTVLITNNSKGPLFAKVIYSGILPVGQEQVVQRGLSAGIVFTDRKGGRIDFSTLAQGTEFVAEVTVKNLKNESVQNFALTQIIPSGWEIVNTRFTDFGEFAKNDANYIDIRDDRTNFYFSLRAGETKKFRILLNASYPGKFYLPGVQAEAMYDNSWYARTKGQWVNVVRQ